jgi:hypothetical protein
VRTAQLRKPAHGSGLQRERGGDLRRFPHGNLPTRAARQVDDGHLSPEFAPFETLRGWALPKIQILPSISQIEPPLHTAAPKRMMSSGLRIGAATDPLEREADRAVNKVMAMPSLTLLDAEPVMEETRPSDRPQRPERSPGGPDPMPSPMSTVDGWSEAGMPLPLETRAFFEPRFGHDFARVRLHTGPAAASATRAINARAFTYGLDIVIGDGNADVSSTEGRNLVAHELAHVVQAGKTPNPPIRRMVRCPEHLDDTDPTPAGWQSYHGDSSVFHCGFRGILEDRTPIPSDAQNECFYDHAGTLVDLAHPYAGCRGTPNQYDSSQSPVRHALIDTGGIVQAGGPAFVASRAHDIAAAIKVLSTIGGVVRSVVEAFGDALVLGILAAHASVDPGNWIFQQLSARSIRHLNVMGSILGSVSLSGNPNVLLTNLTRRLDSFGVRELLDELAQDIGQSLLAWGSQQSITGPEIGALSLVNLVEWLQVQGILQFRRPLAEIARERLFAQKAATP